MHDIFLSYAKEDKKRASTIIDALVNEGFDVWWDFEIPAGRKWDDVIEKAVADSKCVVVLWSKHSITSEFVRLEATEGKNRNILIPARIDDVEIPFAFRLRQATDLINWNKRQSDLSFRRLVDDIRLLVPSVGLDSKSNIEDSKWVTLFYSLKNKLQYNRLWIFGFALLIIAILAANKLDFFDSSNPNQDTLIENQDTDISDQDTVICEQTLQGLVIDATHKIPNPKVELYKANGEMIKVVTLKPQESYSFDVHCFEEYSLRASAEGYGSKIKDIKTTTELGLNHQVDLVLKKTCDFEIMTDPISFDFDKVEISEDMLVALDPVLVLLLQYKSLIIRIENHMDSRGSNAYNEDLTQRRVTAIRNYLIEQGVLESQIYSAIGYGERELIFSDAEIAQLPTHQEKEAAHQQNRRTIFRVIDCEGTEDLSSEIPN